MGAKITLDVCHFLLRQAIGDIDLRRARWLSGSESKMTRGCRWRLLTTGRVGTGQETQGIRTLFNGPLQAILAHNMGVKLPLKMGSRENDRKGKALGVEMSTDHRG